MGNHANEIEVVELIDMKNNFYKQKIKYDLCVALKQKLMSKLYR
jgi:hypothetical protein